MGKRRRKRTGTAAQEFLTEDLKTRVTKMMDNRRRLLAPFPVSADDIYDACWTREELHAMKVLEHYGEKLFEMGTNVQLKGYEYDGKRHIINVRLPDARPANERYNTQIEWGNVPLEYANQIVEWAPLWLQQKNELNRLVKKIEDVAEFCRTYGQIHRLWPDLLSFFDEGGQEKIRTAKVRSKLPDDLMIWDDALGKEVLMEEYRPAAFEVFSHMIAECLMLPEIDTKEVGSIEVVG